MKRTFKILALLIGSVVIILDQLLKYIMIKKIPSEGVFLVYNNFLKLKLELIKNPSIAFGIKIPPFLIYFIILIILIFLFYLLARSYLKKDKPLIIAIIIIISSAISNLLDRISQGAVIDYISITIYNFQWAIFNLADLLIICAVMFLIIKTLEHENMKARRN